MLNTGISIGIAILMNLVAISSLPADWISADELTASCDAFLTSDDVQDGSLCRAFVHGYLVGAGKRAGGDGIAGAASPVGEDAESFSDRALKTRVSPKLLERVGADGPPEYCLEESTQLSEVARILVDQLGSDPESAQMPDKLSVRQALAREFPCDT